MGDLARWTAASADPALRDAATSLRTTTALELKWGVHAAGEARPAGWAAPTRMITLSVLVAGDFRLAFRGHEDAAEREVPLRVPGEYAIWGSDLEHWWQATSDSVVLTVRWPEVTTNPLAR